MPGFDGTHMGLERELISTRLRGGARSESRNGQNGQNGPAEADRAMDRDKPSKRFGERAQNDNGHETQAFFERGQDAPAPWDACFEEDSRNNAFAKSGAATSLDKTLPVDCPALRRQVENLRYLQDWDNTTSVLLKMVAGKWHSEGVALSAESDNDRLLEQLSAFDWQHALRDAPADLRQFARTVAAELERQPNDYQALLSGVASRAESAPAKARDPQGATTRVLSNMAWNVISKVTEKLILEALPIAELKAFKDVSEELRSIYTGNFTPQRKLEELSGALERLGRKLTARGRQSWQGFHALKGYLDVVTPWLKELSAQWMTVELGIEAVRNTESMLGQVQGVLQLTGTMLSSQQLAKAVAPDTLSGLVEGVSAIRQTLAQVQLWQALPGDARLDDYLGIVAENPLVKKVLDESALKLGQALAQVQRASPYPSDGPLSAKLAWLAGTLSSPALRERLQPHLEMLLGGKPQADQLFAIFQLVDQLRHFPVDSSLGGQALWLLSMLNPNIGDTPALAWIQSFQSALGADPVTLSLVNRLLTLNRSQESRLSLMRDLSRAVAPSLGELALSQAANHSLPTAMARELEKFYQESSATESWAGMAGRMARSLLTVAKPYVIGTLMSDPLAAATVEYAEAIQKHTSWEETLCWFVAHDTSQDKTLQYAYSQYLNAMLVWQVYQALNSRDSNQTEDKLRQLARQLKDYQAVKSYPQLEKLIDLIPLLPALREAYKTIGAQPPADSWLGWGDQWLEALAASKSPSLLALRDDLSRKVETWLADAVMQACDTAVQQPWGLLPGASAASVPPDTIAAGGTTARSTAASGLVANWQLGAGIGLEALGLAAIGYAVWQWRQGGQAAPSAHDIEMQEILVRPPTTEQPQTDTAAFLAPAAANPVTAAPAAQPSSLNRTLPLPLLLGVAGVGAMAAGGAFLYRWASNGTAPASAQTPTSATQQAGEVERDLDFDNPIYTRYIDEILKEEQQLRAAPHATQPSAASQAMLEQDWWAGFELKPIDVQSLLERESRIFGAHEESGTGSTIGPVASRLGPASSLLGASHSAADSVKPSRTKREVASGNGPATPAQTGATSTVAPLDPAAADARRELDFSAYDDRLATTFNQLWDDAARRPLPDGLSAAGKKDYYLIRFHVLLFSEIDSINLENPDIMSRLLGPRVNAQQDERDYARYRANERWMMAAVALADQVKEKISHTSDASVYLDSLTAPEYILNLKRSSEIGDVSDDIYFQQRQAWLDFPASSDRRSQFLNQIDLTNTEKMWRQAIVDEEEDFLNLVGQLTQNQAFDGYPDLFVHAFKMEVEALAHEMVTLLNQPIPVDSSPSREVRLEFRRMKKFHLVNLLVDDMENYDICRRLKAYGPLHGRYSGDRAVFEAKKVAAELVSQKFGNNASASVLSTDEKIIAYYQILNNPGVSDEVKFYLTRAASLAFFMMTTGGDAGAYRRWDSVMFANFNSASNNAGYYKRLYESEPPGYRGLDTFRKSDATETWAEYYNQFVDYRNNSRDFDARRMAYSTLLGLGLTDYDISQMKPRKIVYGNLTTYFDADPLIKALLNSGGDRRPNGPGDGIFHGNLRDGTSMPGTIGFIPLEDGRILAIAGLNLKIVAKIFDQAAVASSRTLREVRDSEHLPYDTYPRNNFPQLEGKVLLDTVLRPLFGSDANALITGPQSQRGFPILNPPVQRSGRNGQIRTVTSHPRGGSKLLPVVDEVMRENLNQWVDLLKTSYRDRNFWSTVLELVPLYSEMEQHISDPEHRLNLNSITWDVVGILASIVPAIGGITRLGSSGSAIVRNAIFTNLDRGLTGKALARGVFATLSQHAGELASLGLKGLAYAAYAGVDAASPISPGVFVSPVMRGSQYIRQYRRGQAAARQFARGELEALGGATRVSVMPNKAITLRGSQFAPGEVIEESRALFQPLGRKQPVVRRAGKDAPYERVDACAAAPGSRRIVRRGVEDLFAACFPAGRSIGAGAPPVLTRPASEQQRVIVGQPSTALPAEMSSYLTELRANPEIAPLMANPRERCREIAPKVAQFMRDKGMQNIQYRGMYMWSNAGDNFPRNHYVVTGTKNGETYVFDLTANQFADRGMPSLDAPLILPEAAWAQRFQTASPRTLIKYKDFDSLPDAGHVFDGLDRPLPTDTLRNANGPVVDGVYVLAEPVWYRRFPVQS